MIAGILHPYFAAVPTVKAGRPQILGMVLFRDHCSGYIQRIRSRDEPTRNFLLYHDRAGRN